VAAGEENPKLLTDLGMKQRRLANLLEDGRAGYSMSRALCEKACPSEAEEWGLLT